jgi:hypothetical protein
MAWPSASGADAEGAESKDETEKSRRKSRRKKNSPETEVAKLLI